jgi:hypothetical protein
MTGRRTKWFSALALVGVLAAAAGTAKGGARSTDSCLVSGGGGGDNVCIGSIPVSKFRVVLKSTNGSRERGVAWIEFGLHETRVVIRMSGAPREVSQPAHLHAGACGSDRKVVASLGSVRNGRGVASVDPLSVSSRRYAIDIHESTVTGATIVACGSVPNGH